MDELEELRKAILCQDLNKSKAFYLKMIREFQSLIKDCPSFNRSSLEDDDLACALIPDDVSQTFVGSRAKTVPGDGNCLYNCVSMYLTGRLIINY